MALVPPDPDSRRQMDRPESLPEGQRGHGAEGEGQPRPTEFMQKKRRRKKTTTHKHIVTDEIYEKKRMFGGKYSASNCSFSLN